MIDEVAIVRAAIEAADGDTAESVERDTQLLELIGKLASTVDELSHRIDNLESSMELDTPF